MRGVLFPLCQSASAVPLGKTRFKISTQVYDPHYVFEVCKLNLEYFQAVNET
jgi:hypothetical protein